LKESARRLKDEIKRSWKNKQQERRWRTGKLIRGQGERKKSKRCVWRHLQCPCRVTVRAQKLSSKVPTVGQTVQTKSPKTMIPVHSLDQVPSLSVVSDAVYYLLIFRMNLVIILFFQGTIGYGRRCGFLGSTDLCGVWVHTYCAFQKITISRKCLSKEC